MNELDRDATVRVIRAVDAMASLLCAGAWSSEVGVLVLERLLGTLVEAGPAGSTDPMTEVDRSRAVIDRLTIEELAVTAEMDGPQAAVWVERAHRRVLDIYDADLLRHGIVEPPASLSGAWERLHRMTAFARRLRLLQAAAGLSAPALAAGAGVPVGQVNHWRAGNSLPGQEAREGLAAALAVHPAWLSADRDHVPDPIYRFRSCPCAGPGKPSPALHLEPLDNVLEVPALWCGGCGQPYLYDHAQAHLYPVPLGESRDLPFHAARPARYYANLGGELTVPWPHALRAADPAGRPGVHRIPDLYAQEPRSCWMWTGVAADAWPTQVRS